MRKAPSKGAGHPLTPPGYLLQVRILEYDPEQERLTSCKTFTHGPEVWSIAASPEDQDSFITVWSKGGLQGRTGMVDQAGRQHHCRRPQEALTGTGTPSCSNSWLSALGPHDRQRRAVSGPFTHWTTCTHLPTHLSTLQGATMELACGSQPLMGTRARLLT